MDPENRLVAAELEKGWESALRALAEAEQAALSFERERPQTDLDPTLRAGLADFGRCLPELWDSGRLSVEHKKKLLRSLIRHTVLSRAQAESVQIRIVWISGAVSTLSVGQPIRRSRDLSDYEVMVEKILALSAEGYSDAKIARSLTEEGYRAARSEEGIPAGFVSEVRRQHGQGSVFQRLRSREKLEGSWTVRGLAKELEVRPNRIYNLIESGVLATEELSNVVDRAPITRRPSPRLFRGPTPR